MLSVYTGRYFDLRIYVAVTSPYSWESGRYKLASEPRLWTSSVRPEGNSIVKRFATGTHEYNYKVITRGDPIFHEYYITDMRKCGNTRNIHK